MNILRRRMASFGMLASAVTMVMGLTVMMPGQETPKAKGGIPDDWSHRHLVFTDPGTASDALAQGRLDEWYRIVNEPRYQIQQLKRSTTQRQVAAAPDFASRMAIFPGLDRNPDVLPIHKRPVSTLETTLSRDWSMTLGGSGNAASLTASVGSTINTTTLPASSSFTLDGQTFASNDPTFASATGRFSTRAGTGARLTIVNGTHTLTLTAGTTNSPCSSGTDFTATFARGTFGNAGTYATGIISVLGSGSQCSTNIGVTASGTSPALVLTANTAGTGANSITLTWGGFGASNFSEAWNGTTLGSGSLGTTAGSDGTNSATGFAYWSGSAYASQSEIATNIAIALGLNSTIAGAFTIGAANSPSIGDIVITFDTAGTGGNSQALTPTFTALTGGSFSGGTVGIQASVGAGQSPAKYSFGTTSASCSDYVVYNTGVLGSASQATVVAYNNIYKTTCGSTVPTVAWAYNTGGTVALSPVLSLDGTQVAFIQTVSSVASLVLLKPSTSSGGMATSPASITSVANGAYRTCTAPCYTTLTLNGSRNDTNSEPFYDYSNDIIWVGDNGGYVHKFTGVFTGTPAEASAGGWPVHASTETAPALTGPVYDSGTTKAIFVNDASGYLHSVTTTGVSSQTISTSSRMECGSAGFADPPVVDSTTERVYVFVGDGCDATPGNSYINRFAAATITSFGTPVSMGNAGTNSTTSIMHAGAFDNTYYTGAGTTGNLYVCANGTMFQIPMSGFSGTPTAHVYKTFVSTVNSAAICSPLTEFYNGTQDYIFLSVAANGNATTSPTCTGACIYNFNVQGAGATGNPTSGLASAGGTSGIIIDNNASGGGSQIYFSNLTSDACTGNGTTGSGSGGCAVQASQTGLN